MKVLGIEHIGLAVAGDSKAEEFWRTLLGESDPVREMVAEQGVQTTIFPTGKGKIELLEGLDEHSPITKYLQKKGAGVHHICLEVNNIAEAMAELRNRGIDLIYAEPKTGAEGYLINFIHPKVSGGVLVELAQKTI